MPTEVDLTEGLVRIRVPLERSPGDAGPSEDWIWGEPLGSGRFRVESCPFFAYGVSRDDVVRVAEPAAGDAPELEDVIEKSGHRTLRMQLAPPADVGAPDCQALLGRLLEAGCTHELLRPRMVVIDVPPEADLAAVAELLQARARQGALEWEWADPRPS